MNDYFARKIHMNLLFYKKSTFSMSQWRQKIRVHSKLLWQSIIYQINIWYIILNPLLWRQLDPKFHQCFTPQLSAITLRQSYCKDNTYQIVSLFSNVIFSILTKTILSESDSQTHIYLSTSTLNLVPLSAAANPLWIIFINPRRWLADTIKGQES